MFFSLNASVFIQAFGRVRHKQGAWHRGRVLDTHLILYVTDGCVPMQIGTKNYHAAVGDILFIPRGVFYKPTPSDGCEYYFFHFDMEEAGEERPLATALSGLQPNCTGYAYYFDHPDDMTLHLAPHFTPHRQQAIGEVLSRVDGLDVMHRTRDKMRLNLYFREFLVNLATSRDNAVQLSDTTARVVRYILDHIRTPVSLGGVAEAMYLSESYIARLFKREMGMSVGNYIVKQKMNLACVLLADTDVSISEIAAETGFASPYYFTTTFTKYIGISPSAYRKKM